MGTENETEVQVSTPEQNYIEVINNLRDTTVSKAEYEKLLQDNKMLAQSLATTKPSTESVDEPTYTQDDINALTKRLQSNNLTNLEFIKSTLEYRDACLAVHGADPFLPHSNDYVPTDADIEKAEEIAEGLRQMVDYSGNDHKLFNSELKRCCR